MIHGFLNRNVQKKKISWLSISILCLLGTIEVKSEEIWQVTTQRGNSAILIYVSCVETNFYLSSLINNGFLDNPSLPNVWKRWGLPWRDNYSNNRIRNQILTKLSQVIDCTSIVFHLKRLPTPCSLFSLKLYYYIHLQKSYLTKFFNFSWSKRIVSAYPCLPECHFKTA